jgi:hypothetical protein
MGSQVSAAEDSLLRHRSFVTFWLARTCSSFGFQMFSVAVSWQIYAITHSAMALRMIGLMQFLPSVLLALLRDTLRISSIGDGLCCLASSLNG